MIKKSYDHYRKKNSIYKNLIYKCLKIKINNNSTQRMLKMKLQALNVNGYFIEKNESDIDDNGSIVPHLPKFDQNIYSQSNIKNEYRKTKLDSKVLDGINVITEELSSVESPLDITESSKLKKSGSNRIYSRHIDPPKNLVELLESVEVEIYANDIVLRNIEHVLVTGLENEITNVEPGDLFFCLDDTETARIHNSKIAYARGAKAMICGVTKSNEKIETDEGLPILEVDDIISTMGKISSSFYSHPSRAIKVIGLVGSRGKTTTSWLIRGILEQMENFTALLSDIEYSLSEVLIDEDGMIINESNIHINRDSTSPLHFTPYPTGKKCISNSTPDSLNIQRLLAGFLSRRATACVIECSFTGLAQGSCDYLDIDIAVHTNFINDHYDCTLTFPEYIQTNLKIFRKLTHPNRQWAIINIDDPYAEKVARSSEQVPVATFSMTEKNADVFVEKAETSIFETSILINTPLNTRLKIVSRLIGKNNIYNILAAIAAGIALGAPLKTLINGVEAVEIVPGRCELIDEGQDFALIVDSAHRPETFSSILDTLRECKPSRLITVFGCCGDQEKSRRAYMGEIAHFKSDIVIVTTDHPRSERPDQIVSDIVAGWPDDVLLRYNWFSYPWYQDIGRIPHWCGDQALFAQSEVGRFIIEDRYLALRCAIFSAQRNDVVIIAGKGHNDYQDWSYHHIYGDSRHETKKKISDKTIIIKGWFDDRRESRDALYKLPQLNALTPGLDRSTIPWMWSGLRRRHPLEEWDDGGLASM
eukprot:gnl/TRDRNA2_/TRDRNA2_177833_c0_seq1.p1 gnl/TRDRNA2_/TRDRNA2_177833_c0~~gnl/TRDRNA2_/TRDRNA2_177833_c0_seq1.p1  ORF type:complete len:761 (-),score=-36.13 gnl/TRDRNA2_/TRDRNA2_177833_c0_seq1:261-2543(-)